MAKQPVIAIKLDGVVALYDQNRGSLEIGRPVPGAPNFLRWLVEDEGWIVVLVTGRRRTDVVERWCAANGIMYSAINHTPDDASILDHSREWVTADYYLLPVAQGGTFTGQFIDSIEPLVNRRREFTEQYEALSTRNW